MITKRLFIIRNVINFLDNKFILNVTNAIQYIIKNVIVRVLGVMYIVKNAMKPMNA